MIKYDQLFENKQTPQFSYLLPGCSDSSLVRSFFCEHASFAKTGREAAGLGGSKTTVVRRVRRGTKRGKRTARRIAWRFEHLQHSSLMMSYRKTSHLGRTYLVCGRICPLETEKGRGVPKSTIHIILIYTVCIYYIHT